MFQDQIQVNYKNIRKFSSIMYRQNILGVQTQEEAINFFTVRKIHIFIKNS